ncbi:DUF3801 domain-containing protein [Lactococcus petauri]|uniref:DUF3801 domain-containing protein n=1 Tax=Lactococcus petauri TaxID=1940789 RepID=UPI001F59DD51|nr:DUF3801 domain-containing protein [Lactococcus petauri]
MEQKELIDKFLVQGEMTLLKLLQVLAHLSSDGLNAFLKHSRPLKGETHLYQLLARSDPTTVTFLKQGVDLHKAKAYFKECGLPFAFEKVKEGTQVYFRVKDSELAKAALSKIFTDMTTRPGHTATKLVQTPGTQTFEEKLQKAQEKQGQVVEKNVQDIAQKMTRKGK